MSIICSPFSNSTASDYSSWSEDSTVSLTTFELAEREFTNKFKNCEQLRIGECKFSEAPLYIGEISSFTSTGIGDSITMFGIGEDESLFAWHSSTVGDSNRQQTDKEIVLEELKGYFSKYKSVKDLQVDIYLVGGNDSLLSNNLYNGIVGAIPEFFTDAVIVGEFINPTKNTRKSFLTANFNTKGELFYYLH